MARIIGQRCFLRMGSDYLSDAIPFCTIKAAIAEFESTARALWRYGQAIEGTLHFTAARECEPDEYPDRVLSIGPRGGLKIEKC